ncbi:ArsR/SmtB family transcription factor [Terribacillus saccharophilus]|uniref:ArsR/SmtB family transcription factor n=1 Tax=Terribacillus saccharophilus TaxID=361277 RepID=UPI002989F195|nr:metalloregulator ArsR/SmtB family transcription factor [Terribacillus saccharophilus]MCM3225223.1 metalloregulator ArsR/SmtB family transcription factor [Terribacillus saccharophilus]
MTSDKALCQITCIHQDKVDHVKEQLTDRNTIDVAKILKAVADDTRVQIVCALTIEDELCVCDVANIIESSVATTSHHLRTLKKAGIASTRKEGKTVYYKLEDNVIVELVTKMVLNRDKVLS